MVAFSYAQKITGSIFWGSYISSILVPELFVD